MIVIPVSERESPGKDSRLEIMSGHTESASRDELVKGLKKEN